MSTQRQQEFANLLAIDGGTPVRSSALPWELPGAQWIDAEEAGLVEQVVHARSPFRFYGPDLQHMVDTLEREWHARFGHQHVLAVSSGTAALSIALSALGIGPGDEVAVPGYLWVSCVSAVVRSGAIPLLVDIDDSFCIDPDDLARRIGPHTRAVLCVHMSGAPGRIKEVADICHARGLKLIEDCAQAAGASVGGRAVGRFGDVATFSFQLNKNITSGEGGLVAAEDETLFRRLVALHDLGYPRNTAGRLDTSDATCQLWGVGARMSELAGAMALAQMRKIERITGAMRSAKWRIRSALKDVKDLAFRNVPDPAGDSGPFLITILPNKETCARFVAALRAEGIEGPPGSLTCIAMRDWGLHWYFNIPSLTERRSNSRDGFPWTHPANAFAGGYDYHRGALPRADDLHDRSMLLAIASTLEEQDITDIVTAFRKVARAVIG